MKQHEGGAKRAPRIEILEMELVDAGRLLAHATVRINSTVTIAKLRVIDDPEWGLTVQGPQIVTQDADGARRFDTLVKLARPLRKLVHSAVVAEYQRRTARAVA